jgi:hypothetical protein
MIAPDPDDHRPVSDGLRFPARVGAESSIVQAQAIVEITDGHVAIWRSNQVVAQAACETVRARRTRLSLGSAVRMRVGDKTFAVDLSTTGSTRRFWWVLELLPPFSTFVEVRAGRRAARELVATLRSAGADAR